MNIKFFKLFIDFILVLIKDTKINDYDFIIIYI